MSDTKLKPCPHCGREDCCVSAVDGGNTEQERWWGNIFCRGCNMDGPDIGPEDTCEAWFEQAAEAWNALPRKLRWSQDKPTQEGFFWYKDKLTAPIIAQITTLDNKLLIHAASRYSNYPVAWLQDLDGEWAGPIPEPQEAK